MTVPCVVSHDGLHVGPVAAMFLVVIWLVHLVQADQPGLDVLSLFETKPVLSGTRRRDRPRSWTLRRRPHETTTIP